MRSITLFLATLLMAVLPASAQTAAQLKQENQKLKTELQALQARCPASPAVDASWREGAISASLDTIRVDSPKQGTAEVIITMTLRNTGTTSMIMNYLSESLNVVDSHDYQYRGKQYSPENDSVRGIPIFGTNGNQSVDTSSVISPSSTRTITFIYGRKMQNGQTPGDTFDLSATFVQFENLGQGRIRKVRDYPVAFTNVSASGRGLSSGAATDKVSDVAEQTANGLLKRLTR